MPRRTRVVARFTAGLAVALAAARPASAAGDTFALENVRLPGATGDVTIVLRDGRIAALGADVAVPPEAERIDGVGLVALPGFIDGASDLFLGGGEKGGAPASSSEGVAQDVAADAFADTAEANRRGLYPERRGRLLLSAPEGDASEKLRQAGFTDVLAAPGEGLLCGQSVLVDLSGLPARDAVVGEPGFLHGRLRGGGRDGGYPTTLMGSLAHLRQAFLDARRLQSWREEYQRTPAAIPRPPSDECLDTLIRVMKHELKLALAVDRENDLRRALALAQEFGCELVIVGGKEGFKVAAELAAAHVPVIASLAFPDAPERKGAKLKKPAEAKPADPKPADAKPADAKSAEAAAAAPTTAPAPATPATPSIEEWEVADPVLAEPLDLFHERQAKWEDEVRNVERLLGAGVTVALTTRGSSSAADFLADLRVAIEKGLRADAAVKALTETPAALFGVSPELGRLQPGMAANLALVEGDLASKERAVRHLFVGGRHFENPKKKDDAAAGKDAKEGKDGKPAADPKTAAEPKPNAADPAAPAKDAAAKLDLTGTWTLTRTSGEGFQSTLTLKQDGATLTGSLKSEMGEADIASGSDNGAEWKIVVTAQFQNQKFDFVLKGTADAQLMTGTMETPFGAPIDIVARRTPKAAARTEAH